MVVDIAARAMRPPPLPRAILHLIMPLLIVLAPCMSCGGDSASAEADAILRQFPDQAAEVLEADEAFVITETGFARSAREPVEGEGRWARVELDLPRRGEDALVMRVSGFEVRVRELGLESEGSLAGRAVAYPREEGASFWTASAEGVEEWLHLGAGRARRGEVVAAWEVEGGELPPAPTRAASSATARRRPRTSPFRSRSR